MSSLSIAELNLIIYYLSQKIETRHVRKVSGGNYNSYLLPTIKLMHIDCKVNAINSNKYTLN